MRTLTVVFTSLGTSLAFVAACGAPSEEPMGSGGMGPVLGTGGASSGGAGVGGSGGVPGMAVGESYWCVSGYPSAYQHGYLVDSVNLSTPRSRLFDGTKYDMESIYSYRPIDLATGAGVATEYGEAGHVANVSASSGMMSQINDQGVLFVAAALDAGDAISLFGGLSMLGGEDREAHIAVHTLDGASAWTQRCTPIAIGAEVRHFALSDGSMYLTISQDGFLNYGPITCNGVEVATTNWFCPEEACSLIVEFDPTGAVVTSSTLSVAHEPDLIGRESGWFALPESYPVSPVVQMEGPGQQARTFAGFTVPVSNAVETEDLLVVVSYDGDLPAEGAVIAYDLSDGTVSWSNPIRSYARLTYGHGYLWLNDRAGELQLLDPATGAIHGTVPVSEDTVVVDVASDGSPITGLGQSVCKIKGFEEQPSFLETGGTGGMTASGGTTGTGGTPGSGGQGGEGGATP